MLILAPSLRARPGCLTCVIWPHGPKFWWRGITAPFPCFQTSGPVGNSTGWTPWSCALQGDAGLYRGSTESQGQVQVQWLDPRVLGQAEQEQCRALVLLVCQDWGEGAVWGCRAQPCVWELKTSHRPALHHSYGPWRQNVEHDCAITYKLLGGYF